jgi:hypothetical protein
MATSAFAKRWTYQFRLAWRASLAEIVSSSTVDADRDRAGVGATCISEDTIEKTVISPAKTHAFSGTRVLTGRLPNVFMAISL